MLPRFLCLLLLRFSASLLLRRFFCFASSASLLLRRFFYGASSTTVPYRANKGRANRRCGPPTRRDFAVAISR